MFGHAAALIEGDMADVGACAPAAFKPRHWVSPLLFPPSLWQGVVAGVLLDKMPAAMRKDVDAAIGELPPGKKQPSRWTRREAAERAAREGDAQPMDVDGGEGGEGAGAPAVVEEEPVRVVALLAAAVAVHHLCGSAGLPLEPDAAQAAGCGGWSACCSAVRC